MDTPLDIAADIGRAVLDARGDAALDIRECADAILARHPGTGLTRKDVAEALAEEAGAAGLSTD
jgi:hypothetical protein